MCIRWIDLSMAHFYIVVIISRPKLIATLARIYPVIALIGPDGNIHNVVAKVLKRTSSLTLDCNDMSKPTECIHESE